jgi:hypothetical protein
MKNPKVNVIYVLRNRVSPLITILIIIKINIIMEEKE